MLFPMHIYIFDVAKNEMFGYFSVAHWNCWGVGRHTFRTKPAQWNVSDSQKNTISWSSDIAPFDALSHVYLYVWCCKKVNCFLVIFDILWSFVRRKWNILFFSSSLNWNCHKICFIKNCRELVPGACRFLELHFRHTLPVHFRFTWA